MDRLVCPVLTRTCLSTIINAGTKMRRFNKICLSIFLTVLLANPSACRSHAQTQPAASTSIQPQVVLRVSLDLLDELVPKTLRHPFDIDTTVESTRFKGSGWATGTISVEMANRPHGADFSVELVGQTTEQFSGTRDPVKFYTRGNGPFVTRATVSFDGQDFRQLNTVSTSKQCVRTYRMCSKQKRLIGKLVRHIGWKKVAEATPKMNKYLGQRVGDGVAEALDKAMAELIQELEQLITPELAATIAELDPASADWRWSLSTEANYFQAAAGPPAASPTTTGLASKRLEADIEVGIKLDSGDARLLGLASLWSDSHQLLKSLLPPAEAKQLPADVGIRSELDWAVLEIGRQGLDRLADELESPAP